MLPDHLSRVIFQTRRPTGESKVVSCPSSAYIKVRLDAHLLDKLRGALHEFTGRMIITGLKLITGYSTTNCERVLQSRLSKTYCLEAAQGVERMQLTEGERMVQTTVSRKQTEESKQGSKGGKTRISCKDYERHRCEGDRLEKNRETTR